MTTTASAVLIVLCLTLATAALGPAAVILTTLGVWCGVTYVFSRHRTR